ncbi:hypothetical protein J1N35_007284 [Gossypium stocksii]|uniref:Uncharacterized protein n=1 Tax=Gossypium stocksii TaxID=47602 RepID=A0A9D3W6C5_9ROSI|nr:hypothetical protein J1N35_007284 [Gossypium stocksii]
MLISSICFAANSGSQDLLSSTYSLQTQGCHADIFDPLCCKLRKSRSTFFNLLPANSRSQDLLSSTCSLQTQGRHAEIFNLLPANIGPC